MAARLFARAVAAPGVLVTAARKDMAAVRGGGPSVRTGVSGSRPRARRAGRAAKPFWNSRESATSWPR